MKKKGLLEQLPQIVAEGKHQVDSGRGWTSDIAFGLRGTSW